MGLSVVLVGTVGDCADGRMGVVVELGAGNDADDGLTVAPMLEGGSDGSTLTCTSLPTSPV